MEIQHDDQATTTTNTIMDTVVPLESIPNLTVVGMTVATILAFGTDSFARQIWKKGHPESKEGFRSTLLFGATHSVAISARVYLGLVAAELALQNIHVVHEAIPTLLPDKAERLNLQEAAPSVAFSIWIGMAVCTIKRVLILQSISGTTMGRVALVDRFIDAIVTVVTLLNIMDLLKLDLSLGMQSILSAGGMGALVFTLASKNLAEGFIGGLAVQMWDAFNLGDKIILQDGTEGVVTSIGLLETHLKGYDNVVTRIPNVQLTGTRVSNLSRVARSRLVQNLRFKYKDLEKLPTVLEEIKAEIRLSCPRVVTDGTGAFFAVLESFHDDHIGGLVIANFDIPPKTADFINNRQEFMLAIARAMRKHDVDFAIPSIEYHGTGNTAAG